MSIELITRLRNYILVKAMKSLCLVLLTGFILTGCSKRDDWYTASRVSAGIAPDPAETSEAVVHVYGADVRGWRGWFAIHTWIATKRTDQDFYLLYDVVGWRAHHGQPVVRVIRDIPDRYWYGAKPKLLKAHQGKYVDAMIDAVEIAAGTYPWMDTYKSFPGPNSNTFIAWVAKQVPELDLNLPFSAIGSGYVDTADLNRR